MNKSRLRFYVNIFLVVAVAGSWLATFFVGSGSLVQNGFGCLKYFTLLSNIFVGVMAAAWLVSAGKTKTAGSSEEGGKANAIEEGVGPCAAKEGGCASERVERLKYIAAAAVGLTFATVMFFLGPIYGYASMFSGVNLPLHLIIPLIAILEIIFLSDAAYTRRDNLLAIIPPLLYGLGYLVNILINGMGEWPDTNDWYFFFYWGYPIGVLIYAALLTATWLIGLLMRKLQRFKTIE